MKNKFNPFLRSALLAAAGTLAFAGTANHAQGAETQYTWNGTTDTFWSTGTNWTGGIGAPTGSPVEPRLNVYNRALAHLIYSAAEGTTAYANTTGRGLVISSASGVLPGSMEITGGSFSTLGSLTQDVVGNAQNGTLTVSGGSFVGGTAGTILGINSSSGTSTLTLSGLGSATISPSENTRYLPVVERSLAMILGREALGAE